MTQHLTHLEPVTIEEPSQRNPIEEWHLIASKHTWGSKASTRGAFFGGRPGIHRFEAPHEEQDFPIELKFHGTAVLVQQYAPINVAGELEQMHKDLLDVRETVRDIKGQLADVWSKLQEMDNLKSMLAPVVKIARSVMDENFALQSLAESSFAFWDNDEDAAYDKL